MADNTILNPGALGDTIATLDVAGVKHELVITEYVDVGGNPVKDSPSTPHPVVDADANTKLNTIITLLGSLTFVQTAATYAAIGASTSTRLIYVIADELNNGDKSLYIYINGIGIMFLQTIAP